jgi:hypothetical protein
LKLEIVALSVEMKGARDSIERRAAWLQEYCHRGPGVAQNSARNWGHDWGDFGGSMTGFRLPPNCPQRVKLTRKPL